MSFSSWSCITGLGASLCPRAILALCPAACLALFFPALLFLSAREVREDSRYLLLFMVIGAAWLFSAVWLTPFFGFSVRDDAIERKNVAAATASAGGMGGLFACFAFANFGEGPTIWTTIGPAALATAVFLALWLAVELPSRISEAIAIDRDASSGLRLAGFLLAAGLILGRAVAGDWQSAGETLADFTGQSWPAALLAASLILLQRFNHPTPASPRLDLALGGWLPAGIFIASGASWVIRLGKW